MSKGAFEYWPTPTGVRFHASAAKVRGVRGPVGSGKTWMSWAEIVHATGTRMPPMSDGVVRARWVVIRNTFDELKSTTVQTGVNIFNRDGNSFLEMHMSPPLEGMLRLPSPDGHPMEIQLLFRAMDNPKAIDHLLGLEISGIYVNEAAQVSLDAIEAAMTRLGRYPPKDGDLKFPSLGVIMDTNPLDVTNWWYLKERERPEGWEFFVQPPALVRVEDKEKGTVRYVNNEGQFPGIGAAENVENHNEGFDYWRRNLGSAQDKIDRFVLNKFVTRKAGKPVYPEWNLEFHCAKKDIEFSQNLPVIVGQDFGRTPCAVIGQVGLDGQIRILDELCSDNMGIHQFTTQLRALLINKYGFYRVKTVCFADPAGEDPMQTDDVTCIMTMNELGIETHAAPVNPYGQKGYHNSSVTRINNVSELLNRRIGSAPAIIVSPCCKVLVDGFNGGYHYRRMRLSDSGEINGVRYTDDPDKEHPVSDVHDALQYLVCGVKNAGMDFSNPYTLGADDTELSQAVAGAGISNMIF